MAGEVPRQGTPADATDYAQTFVWCFIADFAERLVPDKLKGLAAGAGDS
jgi:hypothetical protein